VRFSVQLPTDHVERGAEFVSGEAVAELARAAERCGFDACFVTEHPFPPERWMQAGGHHALDPFVALSFAAAATSRIRLQTHILVLPYRNPFLTAKAVASLDVLSGGRLIVGVAAGYLKGEFRALGVDAQERNELCDEALRAMKAAWSGDAVAFEGRHFTARGNRMQPRPAQRPHPPLWIGGNSRRAIRRAVAWGDGWAPFPSPASAAPHVRTAAIEGLADLETRIAVLRAECEAAGRSRPLSICFSPLALTGYGSGRYERSALLDEVGACAALGVDWLCVGFPATSRAAFQEALERFAAEILASSR
jgi:probable F420-dependent oxidoreductase